MKLTTKKMVILGVLSALSVVLVALIHFPIFPAVPFLEYDPADIPILIATLSFGPFAGFFVTIIVSLAQGLTVSAGSGLYGIIMHIIATGTFSLVSGVIYKKNKTKAGGITALTVGALAMAAVMVGANMVITPIFTGWPPAAVWELMPYIAGFNFIKAGINALGTMIIYKRISKVLHNIEDK